MVLVTGKKRRISPITLILQSPLKEAESSIDACKRYALNAVILLFTVFSKSRNASALPIFNDSWLSVCHVSYSGWTTASTNIEPLP